MSKIWNYTLIALTMMLFFQFAGLPTALGGIFDFVGVDFAEDGSLNQTEISTSNFKDYFYPDIDSSGGWLALLAAGTIVAGLVISGRSDIAIKASFAIAVLLLFVPSLYWSLTYALEIGIASWAVGILAIIFIPFTVGYLISLIYFVAGGTSD